MPPKPCENKCLRRPPGRVVEVPGGEVARAEHGCLDAVFDAGDPRGVLAKLTGLLARSEHDRGRAIGDRGDVVAAQRIREERPGQQFVDALSRFLRINSFGRCEGVQRDLRHVRYPFGTGTYKPTVWKLRAGCMKVNSGAATHATARRTQAERTAATRAVLMHAARKLFADRGFNAVSTQAIVEAAGVTRGALYHQFDDKTALFAAVYEEVEQELVAGVGQRMVAAAPSGPVDAMRMGARLFLELCAEPDVQRIVLIDAPAVLGWERWREVGVKYGLGVIEAMLAQAITEKAIPEQPVRPTAHVLLGALDEAALYISRADDPGQARRQMLAVCDRIISGIAGAA